MDLIVLRSVPRRNDSQETRVSSNEPVTSIDSRLISMDEVRRRWAKKQEVRRTLLTYTPQPA